MGLSVKASRRRIEYRVDLLKQTAALRAEIHDSFMIGSHVPNQTATTGYFNTMVQFLHG
jgi:hypothetical protein